MQREARHVPPSHRHHATAAQGFSGAQELWMRRRVKEKKGEEEKKNSTRHQSPNDHSESMQKALRVCGGEAGIVLLPLLLLLRFLPTKRSNAAAPTTKSFAMT